MMLGMPGVPAILPGAKINEMTLGMPGVPTIEGLANSATATTSTAPATNAPPSLSQLGPSQLATNEPANALTGTSTMISNRWR